MCSIVGALHPLEFLGSDALAFGETDGEITHLFFDSRPASAYERLGASEQPATHAVVAGLSILVFLGAIVE